MQQSSQVSQICKQVFGPNVLNDPACICTNFWSMVKSKLPVRNWSVNTSTAPIFLLFNFFRKMIWVRIQVQFYFHLLDELTGYTKLQLSNNAFPLIFSSICSLFCWHFISHIKVFQMKLLSLEVSSRGQLDEAGFKSVEIETAQRTHIWRNFNLQSQSFCMGLMKTQIT